ncbi:MAG TPA: hypothetical protein VHS55_04230, partial [Solirubrobacteraceae bacterium]|nr:hypothetical protein [Solirubrobacteraceae bacterium]
PISDDGDVGCANAAMGMLEAMRRMVLIAATAVTGLAAVSVAGAIPLRTAAPVKARVTPGTGGPRTTFTLSWANPAQTTTQESLERSETVQIGGPRHSGCVSSGRLTIQPAAVQQVMRLSLTPRRMSATATRTWCTGTFQGSILQTQRFACAPPHLCPLIEIRPQTIARFTFSVKPRA